MRAIMGLIAGAVLLAGCATAPAENGSSRSDLTYGSVKSSIVKGQTTQGEILKLYGSPNLVTKNKSGDEVWNYNRMSYSQQSGATVGGFLFVGGSQAMSTATTKSFDLIVIFDQNDIVKDYSVIAASY